MTGQRIPCHPFDKFVLGERIGMGSYGTVHRVEKVLGEQIWDPESPDPRLANPINPQFAIKILNLTHENYQSITDQFTNEITAHSQLYKHPAILPILGKCSFFGNDPPFILTEYMPNGNLTRVNHHDLQPVNVYKILYGIASGMYYMHQHLIVHRDLKPENILLDANFEPKICDFGLAKHFQEGLGNTGGVGTVLYMAPEIDTETYDMSIDIFSCAMVFYFILSGRKPIIDDVDKVNVSANIKALNLGLRPRLDGVVPARYHDLLKQMWATLPSDRPNFYDICQTLKRPEMYLDGIIQDHHTYEPELLAYFSKVDAAMGVTDIDYIHRQVTMGVPKAIFQLGKEYITGDRVLLNKARGFELIEQAAEKKDRDACFFLANEYEAGELIPADCTKAAHWYHQAADLGHVTAKAMYGYMLHEGRGVQQSYPLARNYLYEASKTGNMCGKLYYGRYLVMAHEDMTGIEMMLEAETLDEGYVFYELGCMIELGYMTHSHNSLEMFIRARELKYGLAFWQIGKLQWAAGQYQEAYESYVQGATMTRPEECETELGIIYTYGHDRIYSGDRPLEADNHGARSAFERARAFGSLRARVEIAKLHLRYGTCYPKNDVEAVRLLNEINFYPAAMVELAHCAKNGIGMAQDRGLAHTYYLKCAHLNIGAAQNGYARLMEEQNDYESAQLYYSKAMENNDGNAFNNYARLIYQGKFQGSDADMRSYYKNAVRFGCNMALDNLAIYYTQFPNINHKKALKFFRRAGAAHKKQHNYSNAVRSFRSAAELGHMQSAIEGAKIAQERGMVNEAFELYQTAARLGNPDAQEYLDNNYQDGVFKNTK